MKLLLISLSLLFSLQGCLAVSAVSAIPGALVEVVAHQMVGEEKSYPYNMRRTLAAIQMSLQELKLDVDVLEIQSDGGYGVGFGNERLDGEITLRKQTAELTTVYVKVRATTREESVEHAIIEVIDGKLKRTTHRSRFNAKKYNNLRVKPDIQSQRVGWYRPGAELEVNKTTEKDWLKLKLPSGKFAYLKGYMANPANKNKRQAVQGSE